MRNILLRAALCSTVLVLGGLQSGGMAVSDATAAVKERQELTIEVTIKNLEFRVVGYGREGAPTAIVVHNKDAVAHGLYSTLFKDTPVRLEGDGSPVKTKNGPAFRVGPGKTMTLHFTKGSAEGTSSVLSPLVSYGIWCDILPDDMKAEVVIVE
jgi:hypothetical protein